MDERNYQILQKKYGNSGMEKLFPYTKVENVLGFDKIVFNFSDLSKFPGKKYKYKKADNRVEERLEDALSGVLFAKKTSTKSLDGSWTIVTECESLGIRVIEVLKKNENGLWEGEIFNG